MPLLDTTFTRAAGIELPIVCGAMYPCSNPELVAAASEAGGIGIVQPLSLVYVHGYEHRAGLRRIRELTRKPIGLNVIVEKSSQVYEDRMKRYVDEALEEGVRFFVTSLGNPRWVCEKAHAAGGLVYHDVTSRKWAERACQSGIDGLIGVNSQAGGHAGDLGPLRLFDELAPLGLPVLCAGGVGDEKAFVEAMRMGYAGVQMGTRFIATTECTAHDDYKNAVCKATPDDIVLTERLTGVPVAVIRTPYLDRLGTKAGPLARWLLKGRKTKHWMRMFYSLQSFWKLKRSLHRSYSSKDFLQAGRSVAGITRVETTAAIMARFRDAALAAEAPAAAAKAGWMPAGPAA